MRAELDEGGAGASTPGLASTGAFAGPTSLTVERVETEADVASGGFGMGGQIQDALSDA